MKMKQTAKDFSLFYFVQIVVQNLYIWDRISQKYCIQTRVLEVRVELKMIWRKSQRREGGAEEEKNSRDKARQKKLKKTFQKNFQDHVKFR